MIVYRLCKPEEMNKILDDKGFDNVGRTFTVSPRLNNFNYEPQTKYLHFFTSKMDLLYLCPSEGHIVCEYCIPDELLTCHEGEGLYLDFLFWRNTCRVKEYAVPTELIKIEYISKVEQLTEDYEFEGEYKVEDYTQKVLSLLLPPSE